MVKSFLKRSDFESDVGQELWDKYFGDVIDDNGRVKGPKKERNYKKKPGQDTSQNELQKTSQNIAIGNQLAADELPQKLDENQAGTIDDFFADIGVDFKDESFRNEKEVAQKATKRVFMNDIVRYVKLSGVVDEDDLCVLGYLALSNGMSFGIEGKSGSGKTKVMDSLIKLVEGETYIFDMSTDAAAFRDSESINSKRYLYITELQKAMQGNREILTSIIKNLTEGKDARRKIVAKGGTEVREYVIDAGRVVIYTLASDNKFSPDDETLRRFLRLKTKDSEEHFIKVKNYKASLRAESVSETRDKVQSELVDLEGLLRKKLSDIQELQGVKVLDPFSEYVLEQLPDTQKSMGYIDHYLRLVDACVRFNYDSRTKIKVDGEEYVVANLEDHFIVHKLYMQHYETALSDFSTREFGNESESKYEIDWNECFFRGLQKVWFNKNKKTLLEGNEVDFEIWVNNQIRNNSIYYQDISTGQNKLITELPSYFINLWSEAHG